MDRLEGSFLGTLCRHRHLFFDDRDLKFEIEPGGLTGSNPDQFGEGVQGADVGHQVIDAGRNIKEGVGTVRCGLGHLIQLHEQNLGVVYGSPGLLDHDLAGNRTRPLGGAAGRPLKSESDQERKGARFPVCF